jgi:Protein of unknown function (DUF1631)
MNPRAELPFDTCVNEALKLSSAWMARWVAQLGSALAQGEATDTASPTRRAYAQSRAALAASGDRLAERWSAGFAAAVRADLARESAGKSVTRPPRALSLGELELMDHRQVQTSVELARLHQVVKAAVDDELIALTALLSAAQGLRKVRTEANPLRPEVVVDALMAALADLNVDDSARQRWLHAGAQALGQALNRFYAGLVQRLQEQGVEPADFVVVPVKSSRVMAPTVRQLDDALVATPTDGEAPLVLTLDHLHQLLVGNLAHSGSKVSDQGASGSGNAMVRTLAAEVVTLMLRNIADDERLLVPVREMVLQLKPTLVHLAKQDPRFFADRQNPARRLLDTITARSLAFATEQDTGFADFALQVHQTVQSLQSTAAGLPERIAERLRRLESLAAPAHGLAMQTLVRVEQRHLLAARVAGEIRAREDFRRAPAVVRRFLLGPWAQTVAHARLHVDGLGDAPMLAELPWPQEAAAQRYMDVLTDLLWSCQLSRASLDRPRLIRVVPAVLRTLREGLDAIDFPRAQAQSFFEALMGLHEAAYKTQRSEEFLASSLRRPLELPPEPWLQGVEARESGYIDTELMEPDFVDTVPMGREIEAAESMTVGAWVDLLQDSRMQRCQLRWASPHRTMFLFTTAEGRPVSLTRRGLDRLTALGRLRVVAEQGVVDEALAAVARLAWVNSGKLV